MNTLWSRHGGAILMAACAFVWLPAAAADGGVGVPLPGLVADPPGSAQPQAATVRIAAGNVSLELGVAPSGAIPGLLVVTTPFGPVTDAEPYPDRHFPELVMTIDGATAVPLQVLQLTRGDQNVTYMVDDAGIDPWAIAHYPAVATVPDDDLPAVRQLVRLHALEPSGDSYLARWTGQRTLRLALKQGSPQRVGLEYRARPAVSPEVLDRVVTATRERDYCLAEAALRRLARGWKATQALRAQEYILSTGIDGHSPASVSFSLVPAAGDPREARALTFLCGPHRKGIAVAGAVKPQPAGIDDNGVLRVLRIIEAEPQERGSSR